MADRGDASDLEEENKEDTAVKHKKAVKNRHR